jgi:hypothetical protein
MTEDERQLSELMSGISERCYSAGWMQYLEYVLWDAVMSGPRNFGHGEITQEDINELTRISNRTKTWIVFDDIHEETAIPLERWEKQFTADIAKDPTKLK